MEQLPDNSNRSDANGETKSNSLMLIAEGIGAYFGKLPVALQKNVTKALGHLLGVPIAYLDGVASELKAVSAARVKVTEAMGRELAKSVKVDGALAEIATATHANKILRHQKNSIKVIKYAAEEMENMQLHNRIEPSLSSEEHSTEFAEISEDWLNAFESEAVNMSSEQMQKLFGKILAGEMAKPSTYSIRTIKLMGQMDGDVANIFRKFCSLCCSYKFGPEKKVIDGRALTFNKNNSAGLHDYGIPNSEVLILEEYGLIANSEPTDFPYEMSMLRIDYNDDTPLLPLTYGNELYMLGPKPPKTSADYKAFGMIGLALSRVGRELLNVVEVDENPKYTKSLINFIESKGLALVRLPEDLQVNR